VAVPNIKSAKKRMRQSAKQRTRNREQRSTLRRAVKQVRQAESVEAAQTAFKQAERLLDRAAGKGLIKKNNAARNKQRLQKVVLAKGG
jgi:small subunit ribosomal protein S20